MTEFCYETCPDKQFSSAALFYALMKIHEQLETKPQVKNIVFNIVQY